MTSERISWIWAGEAEAGLIRSCCRESSSLTLQLWAVKKKKKNQRVCAGKHVRQISVGYNLLQHIFTSHVNTSENTHTTKELLFQCHFAHMSGDIRWWWLRLWNILRTGRTWGEGWAQWSLSWSSDACWQTGTTILPGRKKKKSKQCMHCRRGGIRGLQVALTSQVRPFGGGGRLLFVWLR